MSTAPNMTFGHALVRNLVDSRVGLTDFTDQLQISFHTMNEDAQDPEVQQEITAYHELCALREGLYRATATPLATAKLIGILELPAPHPSGNEANDARARHQHATLMLRTIDKLERRTRPRSGGTALQSSVPAPSVFRGTALQSSVHVRSTVNDTDAVAHQSHKTEPSRVPPLASEHTETRVPPVPSEHEVSEEELVPPGSGGTALQSSVLSDPGETNLHHRTITNNPDTPPLAPSLARAG